MKSSIGKNWEAYSENQPMFRIRGYTEPEEDYENDAINAMEMLARHIGKPIPNDIKLKITSTTQ